MSGARRNGWYGPRPTAVGVVSALLVGIAVAALAPADTTNAVVVSIGPVLVGPTPGFGPADPVGCDPTSVSSLTLQGSAPFQPPDAQVNDLSKVKLSGLPEVIEGEVSLAGSIALAAQSATGASAEPVFDAPVASANGTFAISGQDVFYEGVFTELVPASPDTPMAANRGSCYGWDRGDADPATTSAMVQANVRAEYTGTRTGAGGSLPIAGVVNISVTRNCVMVTTRTGSCGNSASVVFEAVTPPSCVPVPPGAIGWWRGELDNSAAIGPDLSGLSAFSWGRVGSGFAVGSSIPLNATTLPEVSDGLTLEAWIQPAMVDGVSSTIMSRWDFPSTDDSARSYWLRLDPYPSGRLVFEADDVSTRRPEVLVADAPILLSGGFHHVAATWSTTSMALHVNGDLVAQKSSQGGVLNPASSIPFRLGSKAGIGNSFFFRGTIDEPTVYDRALGAAEIQEIVAVGAAGKCPT